jgi:hypothetical protein
MGSQSTAAHPCPDGGALSIAWRAMQQIATAEGQTIFAESGLPFKKGLKIVSEQREDALVQHQVIPGTAHNSSCPFTQDMEARLAVPFIDIFDEPNHLARRMVAYFSRQNESRIKSTKRRRQK